MTFWSSFALFCSKIFLVIVSSAVLGRIFLLFSSSIIFGNKLLLLVLWGLIALWMMSFPDLLSTGDLQWQNTVPAPYPPYCFRLFRSCYLPWGSCPFPTLPLTRNQYASCHHCCEIWLIDCYCICLLPCLFDCALELETSFSLS